MYIKNLLRIFIVILFVNTNEITFADYIEDLAKINGYEFKIKMCGAAANSYSNHSKWVSDTLQYIYSKSKPNSTERQKFLQEFNEIKRVKDDEDYLERKKVSEIFRSDSASREELVYQILTYSRMISYSIAVENVGLSKVAYQSRIEEDCKYTTNK